ncbi:hypothetical protein IWQ62_001635 [Dispira parvispora]|uniref:Uncharacterized protein n=1 Tax=Dispira parvispora TaxID=1520584 RepID=A0A9W8AXH9_9FUNG|nr:hypothetical protein IWQ62_001635 [Dispira parvispora]
MAGRVSALVDKFSKTPEHQESAVTRRAREVISKRPSKASDLICRFNQLGVSRQGTGELSRSSSAKGRSVSENIGLTLNHLTAPSTSPEPIRPQYQRAVTTDGDSKTPDNIVPSKASTVNDAKAVAVSSCSDGPSDKCSLPQDQLADTAQDLDLSWQANDAPRNDFSEESVDTQPAVTSLDINQSSSDAVVVTSPEKLDQEDAVSPTVSVEASSSASPCRKTSEVISKDPLPEFDTVDSVEAGETIEEDESSLKPSPSSYYQTLSSVNADDADGAVDLEAYIPRTVILPRTPVVLSPKIQERQLRRAPSHLEVDSLEELELPNEVTQTFTPKELALGHVMVDESTMDKDEALLLLKHLQSDLYLPPKHQ